MVLQNVPWVNLSKIKNDLTFFEFSDIADIEIPAELHQYSRSGPRV